MFNKCVSKSSWNINFLKEVKTLMMFRLATIAPNQKGLLMPVKILCDFYSSNHLKMPFFREPKMRKISKCSTLTPLRPPELKIQSKNWKRWKVIKTNKCRFFERLIYLIIDTINLILTSLRNILFNTNLKIDQK